MREIVECLPIWADTRQLVDRGESCLLLGPRHYGKRYLLEHLASHLEEDGDTTCVRLFAIDKDITGAIDYQKLWDSVKKQFKSRARIQVSDASSFQTALHQSLSRKQGRIVFLIHGPGRHFEESYWELLNQFNHQVEVMRARTEPVIVVATDDYSTYLYQRGPHILESAWSYFAPRHLGLIELNTTRNCLEMLLRGCGKELDTDTCTAFADHIHNTCGGHPGLTYELLRELQLRDWNASSNDSAKCEGILIESSHILRSIERVLEEDPLTLSETALRFYKQDVSEQNDSRISLLREYGVLRRTSGFGVQLASGAITTIVEHAYELARDRLPNGVHLHGQGISDGIAELSCSDDEIVAVHLSDLHVGEESYRFRFQTPAINGAPGKVINEGKPSLSGLLQDDLKSLGLNGRVNALVMSGDFVWNGQNASEFRRAREVVEEIMGALNIGTEQLVLIPGNHDVGWSPTNLQMGGNNPTTTIENYFNFLELLGYKGVSEPMVRVVSSPDGKNHLQIIGLDSNRVEGPESRGIGYVTRESLEKSKISVENLKEKLNGASSVYHWFVVHHHVFPASWPSIAESTNGTLSTLANSPELLLEASGMGVELIMHGHEHQPSFTEAKRWPNNRGDGLKRILSLGAGSCAASKHLGPFARNHYYVVRRRAKEIVIHSRCIGENGVSFVKHDDLVIPDSSDIELTRQSKISEPIALE